MVGAASLVCSAANAAVLYDSLNATSSSFDPIGFLGPLADSFSTSASGFKLSSLALKLDATTPTDGTGFNIELLSDNSTSPGSLLTTIANVADSSLTNSLSNYTFNLASPFLLSANTRYWIEAIDVPGVNGGPTSANWSVTFDTSGVGVANEFYLTNGSVIPNSGGPYQMLIGSAASVPEPLTISLFGAGLAGAIAMRRRKKAAGA